MFLKLLCSTKQALTLCSTRIPCCGFTNRPNHNSRSMGCVLRSMTRLLGMTKTNEYRGGHLASGTYQDLKMVCLFPPRVQASSSSLIRQRQISSADQFGGCLTSRLAIHNANAVQTEYLDPCLETLDYGALTSQVQGNLFP